MNRLEGATFQSYPSTENMRGRDVAEFHDTRAKAIKNPCGFYELFKTYTHGSVDPFLQCSVRDGRPYLHAGQVLYPVDAVTVTRLDSPEKESELEIYSNGQYFSVTANPQGISVSEVIKRPLAFFPFKKRVDHSFFTSWRHSK